MSFVCTEGAIKDNFLEQIVYGLGNNKIILIEQVPDQQHISIETSIKILNPNAMEHFVDEAHQIFDSTILLYALYQLETKFGKRWHWIEFILKNHPLFKPYKLNLKMIFKLSTYLHFLAGEKFIINYRQGLPHERITNFSFFPSESSNNKKKSTVGRKKKLRSNEKEEHSFKVFTERLDREKARLTWQVSESEEERVGSIFFNKLKFMIQEQATRGHKRFKPSPTTKFIGKAKDLKLDKFNERHPDSLTKEEKKPPQPIVNFTKFLRKLHREEHDKHPTIQEIDKLRKSIPMNPGTKIGR
jgi:hypothetical protein